MSDKPVINTLAGLKQGQKVKVLSLLKDTPQSLSLAANISKLVKDRTYVKHTPDGTREIRMPNNTSLHKISEATSRNISENSVIHDMLPDNEAVIQLLISSILSPKDLMSVDLIFNAPADIVSSEVSSSIINVIKRHFEQIYRIKDKLPKILRDVLFTKGSHILAVLPENTVDDLINRDTGIAIESIANNKKFKDFFGNLGILGPHTLDGRNEYKNQRFGLESFSNRYVSSVPHQYQFIHLPFKEGMLALENVKVVDNPQVLRLPRLQEKIRSDSVKSKLGHHVSKSTTSLSDVKLSALIYKNSKNKHAPIQTSKSQHQLVRNSVTGPLIMQFPSESVIPVFVPGQVDRHVGYFVLLDGNGNPISTSEKDNTFNDFYQNYQNNSQQSQLTNRLDVLVNGMNCPEDERYDYIVNTYADLIEQDLLARLRNGEYNNEYALGKNEDIYRIMLSRTLSQRRTQILFLPVEQVTYFATRYNRYGIGVSIMDDLKIINNLRAIVTTANTIQSIRNSVGHTKVDIKLDPDDPDPMRRFEEIRGEIIRSRNLGLPIGVDSMVDMVNSLQLAQYEFTASGNEMLPDINIEFSQNQTSYPQVDTDFEEMLRRRAISSTGLTVESVDNNFNGETATSVVSSNIMLSRKVMVLQDEFVPKLTDHIRKVIFATPDLMNEIKGIIDNIYDELDIDEKEVAHLFTDKVNVRNVVVDQIAKDFLNAMHVTLPRPTSISIQNQIETLKNYQELLDATIESWVNDEMLAEELVGDVSTKVRAIQNSIKSYYVRKFCAENGIVPELSQITNIDENGNVEFNIYEMQRNHFETIMKSFGKFVTDLKEKRDETNLVLQDPESDDGYGDSSSSSDYDSDSGDSGDSDDSDDFSGDTDFNPDDTSDEESEDDSDGNADEGNDEEPEPTSN